MLSSNISENSQAAGKIGCSTFQKLIENCTQLSPSLKLSDNIDNTNLKLTTDIQKCIHLATTSSSSHSKNYPLSNHIKNIIQEKCKARSRWHGYKYPIDKCAYNQLKNKLSKTLLQYSSLTNQPYI